MRKLFCRAAAAGKDPGVKVSTVLWDVDGTLLDFRAAESAAVKTLFREFDLGECTDGMVQRYSRINEGFWQRLERNEITKPQVLVGRFRQFFRDTGVPVELAEEFNRRYQVRLGDTIVFRDDSLSVVKALRGRVRQYAVSNGTVVAQTKKLKLSGLGDLMDGIFLSEEIGYEKPNIEFFGPVFETVEEKRRSQIVIVGDSLTSDIKGGMNAGIVTCWYDPEKKEIPEGCRIDHVIADLHEIYSLI